MWNSLLKKNISHLKLIKKPLTFNVWERLEEKNEKKTSICVFFAKIISSVCEFGSKQINIYSKQFKNHNDKLHKIQIEETNEKWNDANIVNGGGASPIFFLLVSSYCFF